MPVPRYLRNSVRGLIETLEPRRLRAAVYPTAAEQYAVELINRARASPTAEAQRYTGYTDGQGNIYTGDLNEGLAAGTITADAKQPLAISPYLVDSARNHSAWMVSNSTFDHYENGVNPGQRMEAAGYPFPDGNAAGNWGENIAINWSSSPLDEATTAVDQQRNLFTDQSISDRGHRTNMMDPTRNEVGVGFYSGLYNYPGEGNLNSLAATHDTATIGKTFITGVAYTDAVSDDNFYTPGEGLGGVAVTAKRQGDGQTFTTTTWDSGGYSLDVPAGTYDVTATAAGLGGTIAYGNVVVADQNVKEDFVTGQGVTDPTSAGGYVKIRSNTVVVYGTPDDDVIGVYVDSDTAKWIVGLNGVVTRYDAALADAVAVLAGAGNDRVVVSQGVLKAYVEGGTGKDSLYGGEGSDTLYGNGGNDYIVGGAGNDSLVGESGNDFVDAGAGNDRVYGGGGNDLLFGGAGNDHLWGGPGDDELSGGNGRDYLFGESGSDAINGGRQTDTTDLDPMDVRVAVEVLV